MTSVNFYVSKEEGLEPRLAIVYRLVTMALKRNLSVHIHTDNAKSSMLVDDLLWKKERSSFIPHCVIDETDAAIPTEKISKKEVTISHTFEPMKDCDYLINFSGERPSFFSRFEKLAEIIDSSEEILAAGRKRYVFYRDRGYALQYHQL